jgi:hypothetical protein
LSNHIRPFLAASFLCIIIIASQPASQRERTSSFSASLFCLIFFSVHPPLLRSGFLLLRGTW